MSSWNSCGDDRAAAFVPAYRGDGQGSGFPVKVEVSDDRTLCRCEYTPRCGLTGTPRKAKSSCVVLEQVKPPVIADNHIKSRFFHNDKSNISV